MLHSRVREMLIFSRGVSTRSTVYRRIFSMHEFDWKFISRVFYLLENLDKIEENFEYLDYN